MKMQNKMIKIDSIPFLRLDHNKIQFVMTFLFVCLVGKSFHQDISIVAVDHDPYPLMSMTHEDSPNSSGKNRYQNRSLFTIIYTEYLHVFGQYHLHSILIF